ncbi:sugar ABC transporter permease [Microbacterium sp. ARD31]|uniref:carbohydrate ABC transporter permease n=1 Tax=Microbacterium sp. ARD31 TaxID=2962576 RepID=UPI0028813717|nr:sugar ABC transporter permease [Microbacterium sp. ARD31]MDT0183940.1 sugar ABC transporter permease [Microbacterium sp. ARD31]
MTAAVGPSHKLARRSLTDQVSGYVLLAPSAVGILLFFTLPLICLAWLATQRWDLIAAPQWVGVDNFQSVITDPAFLHSLGVTAQLAVLIVPAEILIGIGLALMLATGGSLRRVVRGIILLPWLVAPLVVGVIWRWIFSPSDGLLSVLTGHRVEWLVDPALAPIVVACVIVWSEAGYVALFFVAGLLTVPPALIDAARIDGAGPLRTLWSIQLPLIRPVLVFVSVTGVVRVAAIYDQVFALTGGGPAASTTTVSLWLYTTAFEAFDIGRAAAGSLVLLLLLGLVVLFQRAMYRVRGEHAPR